MKRDLQCRTTASVVGTAQVKAIRNGLRKRCKDGVLPGAPSSRSAQQDVSPHYPKMATRVNAEERWTSAMRWRNDGQNNSKAATVIVSKADLAGGGQGGGWEWVKVASGTGTSKEEQPEKGWWVRWISTSLVVEGTAKHSVLFPPALEL